MKIKENKAITLIALIITIIILLILAGVSLSMVLGENGLINKTQSSVNKYQEKATNESNILNKIEEYLDKLDKKENDKDESNKGEDNKNEENKQDKIDGEIELSATSGECTYPNTIIFDVIKNTSGGELSVKTSNEDIATATISGNTITVTPKNVDGTATITVTSAATGDYNAKSVTYALTVKKQKTYTTGDTVKVGNYEFDVIGDDGTNVTLLCKTTIGTNSWSGAKSQASTFGSKLGGSGRLLTKAEAEGLAASYRNIGAHYWLADADGWGFAFYVNSGGDITDYNGVGSGGVRPVVVISKSKL